MYQRVKEEIKEIIGIVKECPEALQEKCFEIMLNHLLNELAPQRVHKVEKYLTETTQSEESLPTSANEATDRELEIEMTDFHMRTRKLLENNGITTEELNKLYYKEDNKLMPLYESLATNKMAEGQIRIALLTAFENSIDDGEMAFDGEFVRRRCQELKCYDSTNFTSNFKKNISLFDDFVKYEKGKEIKLSSEGKKELSEVLKQIAKGM